MAKQKSLKKTIKNNKKKKLSLKNIDFKKNWKKLTYGGALALLLFMSVGFSGYTYLKQKNLEAEAAGWGSKVLSVANGYHKTYACKYGRSSVKLTYVNSSRVYAKYKTSGYTRTLGPISTRTTYISSYKFTTSISDNNNRLWGSKVVSRSSILSC